MVMVEVPGGQVLAVGEQRGQGEEQSSTFHSRLILTSPHSEMDTSLLCSGNVNLYKKEVSCVRAC